MRDRWERNSPEIKLDIAGVRELLSATFPGIGIDTVELVSGGLVNTNLKVRLRDRSAPVLLRIYQRGIDDARKEAALIRSLGGRVPVPELLHFAEENPVTGHPCAVMRFIEGRCLDALATEAADLGSAGAALGRALAEVHAVKFARFGFLGPDLGVANAIDLDRRGLLAYIEHSFADGKGPARLGPELTSALVDLIRRDGDRISAWPGPPCLVHGDLNGSNLLFRRDSNGRLQLAAILDWEFAFSGRPGFDFAHLVRPPLARNEGLAEAAAASYRDAGQLLPQDWRAIARLTDVFAWAEILTRPDIGTGVIEDARAFIRAMARPDTQRRNPATT